MRYIQYLNEKAFTVKTKEIKDIIFILNTYRKRLDKIPDIETFFNLVNKTIKEGTGKNIIFKTKDSDSSEITGNINGDTFGITLYVSNDYFKYFNDDKVWNNFIKEVIGSLKHEITHGLQLLKVSDDYWENNSNPIRTKDKKSIEQRIKNLSHSHEIMAYAQNIVVDLLYYFNMDKKKSIDYLKHYKKNGISVNLDEYMSLFKKNSKTIKLLYRYITDIIKKEF